MPMETRDARKRRCGMTTGKAPLPVNALLVFLIVFSILASSAIAVPLSRSFKYMDAPAIIPDSSPQGGSRGLMGHEEDEGRRMLLIKTNDYDGTGANNKHDPPRT